jgi:hypothetical protein
MSINLADFGIDRLSEPEQIQLAEAISIAVESRRPARPISSDLRRIESPPGRTSSESRGGGFLVMS